MKYIEKEIFEIAKKVITDLNPNALKYEKIEDIIFNNEKKLIAGVKAGELHPCWTVLILTIGDNTNFLVISDDTGEPLYYQNFNMDVFEIEKADGKYF